LRLEEQINTKSLFSITIFFSAHQKKVTGCIFSQQTEVLIACGADKYITWHWTQNGQRLSGYLCNSPPTCLQYPLFGFLLIVCCDITYLDFFVKHLKFRIRELSRKVYMFYFKIKFLTIYRKSIGSDYTGCYFLVVVQKVAIVPFYILLNLQVQIFQSGLNLSSAIKCKLKL